MTPRITFGPRRGCGDFGGLVEVDVMVNGCKIGNLYKEIGVMDGYSSTCGVEVIFGYCAGAEGENLTRVKHAIMQEAKQLDWSAVDWNEIGIDNPLAEDHLDWSHRQTYEPDDGSTANRAMLNRIGDMYQQARIVKRDPVRDRLQQRRAT